MRPDDPGIHGPPTPLLDRQAPLPPPAARASGMAVVVVLWLALLLALAAAMALGRPAVLRGWIESDLPRWFLDEWSATSPVVLAVSALGAVFAMIAIHEVGHVLGGLAVGFRLHSLRVGPLVVDSAFRWSFHRGPGAASNGHASIVPAATDGLAARALVMVLAGPLANLLTGLAVLLGPFPMGLGVAFFVCLSLVNGLSDLLPFQSRLGISDGRRIGTLLRHPQRGVRWLCVARLQAELLAGVPPEALPDEFLAGATAAADESEETVLAHGLAYTAAFHRHRDAEAAQRLETCLRAWSHAGPALREAVLSEAAVFQARRRQRPDLTEQWLAAMTGTSAASWLRARVEAALLEARGDRDGAARRLERAERDVLPSLPAAQRSYLLPLVQRWKAELGRG